ncbi:HARBI1 [Mytilus edulis]|uniref:Putative nuclease HARBI1 n=1 Tax=Mytilus edulis TaxID=6550 RepID=A0A8S3TVX7_MYTED|nr:HARBI1 [Mytilus edulis]
MLTTALIMAGLSLYNVPPQRRPRHFRNRDGFSVDFSDEEIQIQQTQYYGDLRPWLDKGTVSRVVQDTTAALCKRRNEFIRWPRSDAEKNKKKTGNYRIGGFPNVIGAIDGTHIRIQAPTTDEASYVNRKGYHSINVQAVCDADDEETDVTFETILMFTTPLGFDPSPSVTF